MRGGYNDSDLRRLRAMSHEARVLENSKRQLVSWLREQGCPWSVVGSALGVTKQSAQRKYGTPARAAQKRDKATRSG